MSEESTIDFKCPHCKGCVSLSDTCVGTAQQCPTCLESVVVPEPGGEPGKPLPLPITTQRLVLRGFEPRDWKDLRELMVDEQSFRYIDWYPLDEIEIERWLEAEKAVRLTHSGGHFCFGVEIQKNSKLIGFVSLYYADEEHRQAGFTMMINRDYRRCGYGKEAVGGLFVFGFEGVDLHRFAVSCDGRNAAARGMLEKAGMRREGEFLKDQYLKAEWINTVWYGLLKEEYTTWSKDRRSQK